MTILVFNSTVATNNIVYAVNQTVALGETMPVATGATVPIGLDTTTTPPTPILFSMPALEMDIFEPSGDTVSERPLIIYLHTGTFAPIIRNGNATGYIANGTMAGISSVNTTLLEEDSLNAHVFANWYTYTGPPNHLILPTAGKILVIKTRDGKYAKVEILSYYKDAPAEITPEIAANDSRHYTFNYVFQPNEGETSFN